MGYRYRQRDSAISAGRTIKAVARWEPRVRSPWELPKGCLHVQGHSLQAFVTGRASTGSGPVCQLAHLSEVTLSQRHASEHAQGVDLPRSVTLSLSNRERFNAQLARPLVVARPEGSERSR